ncbi:hypothetical protein ACW2Q0_28420 [Nocardia sp. R16R-3T]
MSEPYTLPPHIARPANALVGPLVFFRGQQVAVTSSPPTDTRDPRYDRCTDHHLACDCREAEQNENLHELRTEYRHLTDVLAVMLAGHRTAVYVDGNRRESLDCRCQLCEFARTAHAVPWANRTRLSDTHVPF